MAITWRIIAIGLIATLFTISCNAAEPKTTSGQFFQALAQATSVYLMNSSDIYAMDELVTRLKQWGHFRVVTSPKNADLIMDLQYSRDGYKYSTYNIYTHILTYENILSSRSKLILVISDNSTHSWTLSGQSRKTAAAGDHALNMINAADSIAGRLRSLVDQSFKCNGAVADPASKRSRFLGHLLPGHLCSRCECKVSDPNSGN